MPPPPKRLPGVSNAEYDNRDDPSAQFIAGDPPVVYRATRAFFFWLDRRRRRGSSS